VSADPQKERVYEMEHAELAGHVRGRVTPHALHDMARQACQLYKLDSPRIECGIKGSAGWYDYQTRTIGLSAEHGYNLLTLAHELAHYIVDQKWQRSAPHGPTFVRTYAELLDLMRLVPIAGFRAICRRHKVRIAKRA
jgi:hypothetical protein